MGLLSALLLVATVAAVLYLFLIRPTPVAVGVFLVFAAAFIWSWAPALLRDYGSVPAVFLWAAAAVAVPVVFGLAVLFRAKPLVLVWALVLAMPLRVPIPVGAQKVFLLAPLYLVVLAGYLSVVEPDGSTPLWRQDRLRLPLGGLIGVAGLSLIYTAGQTTGVIRYLCFWVAFSLAYHILTVRLVDEDARKHAVYALLGSGVVLAAIGIAQRVTGTVLYNVKVSEGYFAATSLRVNSLFWDPNMFGRFLVLVIVFAIIELVGKRSPLMRWLAASALVLSAPTLVFTFSRSSWMALGFAAILLVWRFLGATKALAVVVALLLIVVLAFSLIDAPAFNVPYKLGVRFYWERFFGGRLALVQGGVAMFAAHPVIGVGLGGFPSAFPRYRPAGFGGSVVESHNSVVTAAAELGIIGLALFAWLLVRYVDVARRALSARSDDALLGVAAVVGTAVLFVHSLFYGAFLEDPFTWFLLSLAAVLAAVTLDGERGRRDRWKKV